MKGLLWLPSTNLIVVLIAVVSSFPWVTSQTTYSCPGLSADPVVVPVGSGSSFSRQINKSSSNTVCVLVRVSPRTNNANMNDIQRNSSNEDYYIVPVARSYNNKKWEKVSGPYVQDLSISNCCNLNIPNLPDLPTNGKFLLMSFSHSATDKEKVARFFHQTTFGPTLDMINSWNYNNGLEKEMGNWLKTQMDEDQTPTTSHRAFFRERLDFPLHNANANRYRRPRHPCDQYSRWRDYSFVAEDYDDEIVVSNWNGKYLIKVGGEPRTVVSSWKDEDNQNLRLGSWKFCWSTEEKVDGEVWIYDSVTDDCYIIFNPPVNVPNGVLTSAIKKVSLPSVANFDVIQSILAHDDGNRKYGGGFSAKSKMTTAGCADIPDDGVYRGILGTFNDGTQVWYSGHSQLDENTLQNPIADGGYAMKKVTVSGYEEYYSEPVCPVPIKSFVNSDSCYLSPSNANACSPSFTRKSDSDTRILVCGSPGEVANSPSKQNTFTYPYSNNFFESNAQKSDVWNMIALKSEDQLRQRMAWALSQILVVTSKQINEDDYSEIYLNYYDIFVRNAFGSYLTILKEVSYSPMMAEMLSYLDSKSSAWVLEDTGSSSYPDENFAREIMQLFSIGLYKLNIDGTKRLDNSGNPIMSYDNYFIQNFARAWTGFTRQEERSNIEMVYWDDLNRLDPMNLIGELRDPFPKMDLNGGFIGDKVPLCTDLPSDHFLKKGATYHLLGSSPQPQFHEYGREWRLWQSWGDWFDGPPEESILTLDSSSSLKAKLASKDPVVILDSSIDCTGVECDVDSLMVVKIQSNPPIYYEYQRQPCVELSFYEDAVKISSTGDKSMCGNPLIDAAYDACCDYPDDQVKHAEFLCYYDFERTTQSRARSRCKNTFTDGDLCHFHYAWSTDDCSTSSWNWFMQDEWIWTDQSCSLKAKVNENGYIAIVHVPPLQSDHPESDHNDHIDLRVSPDSTNYFKVTWDGDNIPKPSNNCGNGVCQSVYRGCLCDINVVETSVFSSLPTESDIIQNLHIGAFDPDLLGSYSEVTNTGNIKVWHKNGSYSADTIFSISYRGKQVFLKNARSTVKISNSNLFKFRNPPSFMNLGFREKRDAIYETNAVLENYFYNDNVAPFLSMRLIQRFGISNPSPRYIETVATAFQTGTYNPNLGIGTFGDGVYGNLEATVAAIILNDEARSVVLDADPTFGSLVEPLLKLTRLMRAMEYETNAISGERIRLSNLQQTIGQEAHNAPSVFSFFRPEYTASGHIKVASITSPEAQVLSGPKVLSLLNGIISMIDLGLSNCYSGFGETILWWCEGLEWYYNNDEYETNFGRLQYGPTNASNAASVVNELSLLLTGGRLNDESKNIIKNAFQSESNVGDGLRIAQKLITSTPEYHSSSTFTVKPFANRPTVTNPTSSSSPYKAIVFMYLDGGSDSFNMLVPHSGCSGGKTSYNHYADVRGAIAIPKGDLLSIDASSSSQVCSTFGVHPNLSHLKTLYDEGDLSWISGLGILQQYCNKNNWWEKNGETALFAHNTQMEETHNMDIYEQQPGRGVGGRMVDVLKKNGFSPTSISLAGVADAIVALLAKTFTLDPWLGLEKLNPRSGAQPLWQTVKKINTATKLGSNLFGETWSNILYQAVGENEILKDLIDSTTLSEVFPDENELGKQFELVSKLVKTREARGADREVFYVQLGGFDTHDNVKAGLDELTNTMNGGLLSFTKEMKSQGVWDDITIVMVSEFARTLPGNTGAGSDHAWAGNYFIAGGDVKGKRILGNFPNVLSDDGPLIFEPGIVIPQVPWEALWNGIAQWFGITNSDDLDEIIPNRNTFKNDLFTKGDLYKIGQSPTPSPNTCNDSSLRFFLIWNGRRISRNCQWVAKKRNARCAANGVAGMCASTCNTCSTCENSTTKFRLIWNGKRIRRTCSWVAKKQTQRKCAVDGVASACRLTCSQC